MAKMSMDMVYPVCYNKAMERRCTPMSKKKRRRRKPTARPDRMKGLAADILAGTISGLITAAILRLLDW